MRLFDRHTALVAGIALLLLVFTVGIPIVLSACPMMAQGKSGAPCCRQTTEAPGQTSVGRDFSCCRVQIVATRATSEYLPTAAPAVEPLQSIGTLPAAPAEFFTTPVPAVRVEFRIGSLPPPSRGESIPLLTSSLLL